MPRSHSLPEVEDSGFYRALNTSQLKPKPADRFLSSAVRQAAGTPWNGFAFFGLGGKPGRKHVSNQ